MNYESKRTKNEIGKSLSFFIGFESFEIANNSFSSLYNPIFVMYVPNSDPVEKF